MPVEATMDEREAKRPNICFVGHGFHQRTKSSKFFISILREIGDVDEYYSAPDDHDLDDDDIICRLSKGGYDLYVFWQCDFLAERLHGLNLGRFVIVPMYDGARGRPDIFWRQFIDCQFISFSRAHHELLRRLGCRSHYFQYWSEPKPTFPERDVERLAGFFWERRPDSALDLSRVIRLCRMLGISDLHLHAVSDLETVQRQQQDVPPWRQGVPDIRVTVSQWFGNFEEFDATATTPLFFFAPRQTEGIGMAVVEAMGRGQIVVSPDAVTMNEYIGRNVTGVLYDIDGPDQDFGFTAGDLTRDESCRLRQGAAGPSALAQGHRTAQEHPAGRRAALEQQRLFQPLPERSPARGVATPVSGRGRVQIEY